LNISGQIARCLLKQKELRIKIDTVTHLSEERLDAMFVEWQQHHGRNLVLTQVGTLVPRSFAEIVLMLAKCPPTMNCADLHLKIRRKICQLLTGLPLTVIRTDGFEKAMVTSGGAALIDINPRSLESRKVRGLFLCGEVVDVDGPCGGFNLQWAFSSGWLAGS
jgi:predicted Rossmann fold flavoprotein